MDTAALKEYLGIVVDMEKNIYYQEQVKEELLYRTQTLGVSRDFRKPTEPKQEKSEFAGLMTLGLVLSGIFLLVGAVGPYLPTGVGMLLAIPGIVGGLLVITSPVWVIFLLFMMSQEKRDGKEKSKKYEEEMEEYLDDIRENQERVQKELAEKALIEAEISVLSRTIEQSKKTLRDMYSSDVIFPKYRNLVMMTSVYEYLSAGRCTTLDGHEGAYNILEMEIRMDRIIVQLDQVIEDLEMIQQNQFMLYSAIQESNAQTARLLESTDRMAEQLQVMQSQNALQGEALNAQIKELQKSSELTAYHAERTQKELAYMNRMDYLTGRNDGPFRNVPPT